MKRIKPILFCIGIVLLVCCILWIALRAYGCSLTTYITDLEKYAGEEYAFCIVFPRKIPETAVEKNFSYHQYIDERDIYLELVFQNVADMEQYLADLKANGDGIASITLQNPYDTDYTDLLFAEGGTLTQNGSVFYEYEIEQIENYSLKISGSYSVISYSYETLTVISAHFDGQRFVKEFSSERVPAYLKRFSVDLNTPIEYRVDFPTENSDLTTE